MVSLTDFFKNRGLEQPIVTSGVFSCLKPSKSWSKWIFSPEIGLDSLENILKISTKPPHALKWPAYTPPIIDKFGPNFHSNHQYTQETFAIHNISSMACNSMVILPNIYNYHERALCKFSAPYSTEFLEKGRVGSEFGNFLSQVANNSGNPITLQP